MEVAQATPHRPSLHRDDATVSQEHAAHEPRSIPRTADTPLPHSTRTITSPVLALLKARHPGETVGIMRHQPHTKERTKGIIPVDKRRKASRVSVKLDTWRCPTCYQIFADDVIQLHLAHCSSHSDCMEDPVWKARFRYTETPGLPISAWPYVDTHDNTRYCGYRYDADPCMFSRSKTMPSTFQRHSAACYKKRDVNRLPTSTCDSLWPTRGHRVTRRPNERGCRFRRAGFSSQHARRYHRAEHLDEPENGLSAAGTLSETRSVARGQD